MSLAVVRIRKEPHYRRGAFEQGLQRVGFTISDTASPKAPGDVLVLWNRKAGADEQSAIDWEKRGGLVLVVENGYLQKIDKSMYSISVGEHNGAGWFPVGDEDRFTPLGFTPAPWRTVGNHLLVCHQRNIGSRMMASPRTWPSKKFFATRTRREAMYRPHPGMWPPKTPLEQDLRGAHACFIWHSAAGVRALLLGYPVFYAAPQWICEESALRLSQPWEIPLMDDNRRAAAMHRMSHGQWTVAEIASGEPFARMVALNWGR